MKESQLTKKNNNNKLIHSSIQKDKLKKSQPVSELLKMAIKRYQFDLVGWTEYCIDNKKYYKKELSNYHQKPLDNLRIQNRINSSLTIPSLKKVYESPKQYIFYLEKEYEKDKAFYEAILKNSSKYKIDSVDMIINKEIDKSAKKYLRTINKRKIDEEINIRKIKAEDWTTIKMSKYPKVQLGLILGAREDIILDNFGIFFINQIKAYIAGTRTAFISATGPESWYEIEKCKAELTYFKKEVINPCLEKI